MESVQRSLADFDELVAVEPRLAILARLAQTARPLDDFEQAYVYGWLKRALAGLVGWTARSTHPGLQTQAAFDIALCEILSALEERDEVA